MSSQNTSALVLTDQGIMGAIYRQVEAAAETELDAIANIINSENLYEDHRFLGEIGKMQKFNRGKRNRQELTANNILITNEKYHNELVVYDDEYEFDKTGQVQQRIDDLAADAAGHRRDLLADLIVNGETGLAYDGQNFFDTDHEIGKSGTFSNEVTFDISDDGAAVPSDQRGTAANPSPMTGAFAILFGIKKMMAFKDDSGERFVNRRMRSITVVGGLEYMAALNMASTSATFANDFVNPLLGGNRNLEINTVIMPEYTGNQIDIYRNDAAFKALIAQEVDGIDINALGRDSEHYAKEQEALFNVYVRRGVGYGEPRSACRVKLTA